MRHSFLILAVGLSIRAAQAQELLPAPSRQPIHTPDSVVMPIEPAGTNPPNQSSAVSFLLEVGAQYDSGGDYAEAEQAYTRALKADPSNFDIRFRLSTLYIQTKNYAKAIEVLEALATENPDNPLIQNNLAWVYSTGEEVKNGTLALRHAREAILIEPYNPSLWNTLAEAYCVSGQYDKALRASEAALDLLTSQEGASPEEIRMFEAQLTRIRRTDEACKQLLELK